MGTTVTIIYAVIIIAIIVFIEIRKSKKLRIEPEDYYIVTLNDSFIRVEHPKQKIEEIAWSDIEEIKLINTDQGPFLPDVWLALLGRETGCLIPQGAEGYDTVYDRVSKYDGFDFENVVKSMGCVDNVEFLLWKKK